MTGQITMSTTYSYTYKLMDIIWKMTTTRIRLVVCVSTHIQLYMEEEQQLN